MLRPVESGYMWHEDSDFAIDAFGPKELGNVRCLVRQGTVSLSRAESVCREKMVKLGDAEFEALNESDQSHVWQEDAFLPGVM